MRLSNAQHAPQAGRPSNESRLMIDFFFFQAEDGIRDLTVTGVQTCALPIWKCDDLCLRATFVGWPNRLASFFRQAHWLKFFRFLSPWKLFKSRNGSVQVSLDRKSVV